MNRVPQSDQLSQVNCQNQVPKTPKPQQEGEAPPDPPSTSLKSDTSVFKGLFRLFTRLGGKEQASKPQNASVSEKRPKKKLLVAFERNEVASLRVAAAEAGLGSGRAGLETAIEAAVKNLLVHPAMDEIVLSTIYRR